MTQKGNFYIYSSSAGSGKTFTLTREYLILILRNPSSFFFKNILAVTFTNDAANEMKKRVLGALKAFSEMEKMTEAHKNYLLLQQIKERTLLPEAIIQKRSEKIFRIIIQEYSDFAIRTIDSFTNQIVSSFTEELDLPFNFEIELDLNATMAESADRLFEKVGIEDQEELSSTLQKLAEFQIDEGGEIYKLNEEVLSIGHDINNDQFYPFISQNEGLELKNYREIYQKTDQFIKATNQYIGSVIAIGLDLISANNLSKSDFSATGNFYAFFDDLDGKEDFIYNEKCFKDVYKKTIDKGNLANPKTDEAAKQKVNKIADELILVFNKLEEIKNESKDKYLIVSQVHEKILTMGLMGELHKEFKEVLSQKNQVTLSEFNRQILKIILSEPVPFIYERIGEKFEHLLIDEFQDTSNLQFFNLLPLIENSVSKGNMNLLVGDAKQSIYRWRGGNISLIIHLFNKEINLIADKFNLQDFQEEQLEAIQLQIEPENLQSNYRSRKEIIEFNNDFFAFVLETKSKEFPFLAKAYQSYEQLMAPNSKNGGGTSISFLENSEKDEAVFEETFNAIQAALEKGYSLSDIAILTRKNGNLIKLATFLTQKDIPILSKESLLLKNSPVVNLIINLLKVIQSPEKQLFKNEFLFVFENQILEQSMSKIQKDAFKKIIIENDNLAFFELFEQFKIEIEWFEMLRMGLIDLVELIIRKFDLYKITSETEFLFEFQDFVANYATMRSNQIQDLLTQWDDKKKSLSVGKSNALNAVTMMTIHGSKGLEFPIVIIPFANWSLKKDAKRNFWIDLKSVNTPEFEIDNSELKLNAANFKFNKTLKETTVAESYNEEGEAEYLEGMNLAYVAFTRSVNHLHIICHKNGLKSYGEMGNLMVEYVAKKTNVDAKNIANYTSNEYEVKIKKENEVKKEPVIIEIDEIISSNLKQNVRLKRDAEKLFDDSGSNEKKEWGKKIHAAFERINTKKDIDDATQRILFDGMIVANEVDKIKKNILQVIDNVQLANLFTENVKVINERDILQKNKAIERPDRVVLTDNETFVIDYKTGEERDSYNDQIKRYGRKYAQMGYKNIRMLLVYLGESSSVVEVY
jgi:ATP-dependent helicase/nuclease subunit A